jgi:hypothetical protein
LVQGREMPELPGIAMGHGPAATSYRVMTLSADPTGCHTAPEIMHSAGLRLMGSEMRRHRHRQRISKDEQ